jgi:GntR family transcriptional regulator
MTVVKDSPVPLYLQIEEEVRARIEQGSLAALGQVPSEAELSEEFSVSRMTARKALDRLVAEGILFRRPGKGTFVAPAKISHRASTQLSFSAAMEALGRTHSTRVLEAAIVPIPARVANHLEIDAGGQVVSLRRVRFLEDDPVAIHAAYLPVRYAGVLEGDLSGSLTELMRAEGARIADARDFVESVQATAEQARLLGVSAGAPLLRIEGTAYAANMEPVRYTDALYRGDRFRFGIDTQRPADLHVEIKTGIDT